MQMVEDTLIEHAHTKPLLPSQLIRYREVQVPDGRSCTPHIPYTQHLSTHHHLPVTSVSTATMQRSPYPALLPSSSLTPCCVCKDLIRFNIPHFPQRNITSGNWRHWAKSAHTFHLASKWMHTHTHQAEHLRCLSDYIRKLEWCGEAKQSCAWATWRHPVSHRGIFQAWLQTASQTQSRSSGEGRKGCKHKIGLWNERLADSLSKKHVITLRAESFRVATSHKSVQLHINLC